MTRPGFAFSTRFKVRYAEIDGQKVVFNSRYLEYADAAVTEFWAWTGVEALPAWRAAEFHVRRSEIDYLKPFVWGDTVEAFVRIVRVGTSSLTKHFELCNAETGELHCAVTMTSVNVDLSSHRSAPFDPAIRAFLETLAHA